MDRATNCSPNNEKLPSCSHQCADMSGTLATTCTNRSEACLLHRPRSMAPKRKAHHRCITIRRLWSKQGLRCLGLRTLEWLPSAEEITGTSADLSEQIALGLGKLKTTLLATEIESVPRGRGCFLAVEFQPMVSAQVRTQVWKCPSVGFSA